MKKGYLFIILTAFIFSTMEIAGKMLAGELNSFQVTFLRFLIGAVILTPFALKELRRKKLRLNRKDYIYFALTGILCIPVSMVLLQVSVNYTKASTAAVVFSINPIFTVPFAYLILKESINKRNIYSMVLSFLGVVCIFNPFKMDADIKGIIIALTAAVTFSLYTVISKKKIQKYGGLIFNCGTFIIGDAILLIILIFFKQPIFSGITINIVIGILFIILGSYIGLAAKKNKLVEN